LEYGERGIDVYPVDIEDDLSLTALLPIGIELRDMSLIDHGRLLVVVKLQVDPSLADSDAMNQKNKLMNLLEDRLLDMLGPAYEIIILDEEGELE